VAARVKYPGALKGLPRGASRGSFPESSMDFEDIPR